VYLIFTVLCLFDRSHSLLLYLSGIPAARPRGIVKFINAIVLDAG
jgi:hypothetical protein